MKTWNYFAVLEFADYNFPRSSINKYRTSISPIQYIRILYEQNTKEDSCCYLHNFSHLWVSHHKLPHYIWVWHHLLYKRIFHHLTQHFRILHHLQTIRMIVLHQNKADKLSWSFFCLSYRIDKIQIWLQCSFQNTQIFICLTDHFTVNFTAGPAKCYTMNQSDYLAFEPF